MNRRDILKQSALFAGAALSTGTIAAVVSGCQTDTISSATANVGLSADHLSLVSEIAERIIPRTDTPGAKDAKVGEFINRAVKNTFTSEESTAFAEGLGLFSKFAKEKFNARFTDLDDAQMDEVLTAVVGDFKSTEPGAKHIWPAMKGMVLSGFFNSEVGAKEVLKYDPIPGEWIACIDYSEVDGLWAI